MPLKRLKIEDLEAPPPLRNRRPLTVEFPELEKMWLRARNKNFKAEQFSSGSNIEAWFKCPEGKDHIFQKSIYSMVLAKRNGARGCPACKGDMVTSKNSLLKLFPHIAKEYSHDRNSFKVSELSYGSSRRVWWHCSSCGHYWQTAISNRTQLSSGCPRCHSAEPEDLIDLAQFPYALKCFSKRQNKGVDPRKLPPRTLVWWKCKKGEDHIWQSMFKDRPSGFCPYCKGSKASYDNNLTQIPALAKELHPTNNGHLKAKDVPRDCYKLVWWKCKRGPDHEWQARVNERVNSNSGCPFCRNHRLSVTNSLAHLSPEIAREWHPRKNGKKTPNNVVAFTTQPYWFLCPQGHSYQKRLHLRFRYGAGCPHCKLNEAIPTRGRKPDIAPKYPVKPKGKPGPKPGRKAGPEAGPETGKVQKRLEALSAGERPAKKPRQARKKLIRFKPTAAAAQKARKKSVRGR